MNGGVAVTLSVNGQPRELHAQPWHTLLDRLRDQLLLTGVKRGCDQGVCGACTVLMDGHTVCACLALAVDCAGADIITIEGLAEDGRLSPVQQAFAEAGAVQCGFCTPGMILAATALLSENPAPTEEEIREGLSGNLCRCSGYTKIFQAVRSLCMSRPS